MLSCLCARRFSMGPTIHSGKKRNMPPDCLQPIHDSAGKIGIDIMPPRAIAHVQKETEDAWVGARVQEPSVAASDGCSPSLMAAAMAVACNCVFACHG